MDLISKLKNLIKRALITLNRTNQFGQCSYLETTSNYQALYPYGMYAIPRELDKPLIILININGDESNKIGIENDPKTYPLGLTPGDVVLYSPVGLSQFKTDANGKIAIGNNTIELLQKISDALSESINDATAASVHTHTSAGAGSPSSVPINAASFSTVATNLTSIKTLIDTIKGTIL